MPPTFGYVFNRGRYHRAEGNARFMIACIRCGRWHLDAERAEGRRLTCTEVKQYWSRLRVTHREKYGHYPHITTDDGGVWICLKCNRPLRDVGEHTPPTS